ncbi:Flagellar hook-associated protein 2 [Massilia sp. Bi118]|uniref:flagellar filament capping protein FliD n=1 Tax=Massilia sp. Bi118 TaxID=2822346 RepID=UPI001E0D05F4|nr:flagellar filament capping protein FliD [Massilia sp. Bi118]CAH0299280.1 Flagellar hook-associated protein 2 [Massilia sp. Bi118]
MGLSSSGIGSGLDVDGLVSKLMQAESAPLANYAKKSAAVQSEITAYGKLSAAIGSFQGSLSSLSNVSTFRALGVTAGDTDVLSGSASGTAVPGNYKINVSQLASAQSLTTTGRASTSAMIGAGAKTVLTFQFGSVGGGSFGVSGTALGAGVSSGGIAAGSLTLNGTAIATDGNTRSAKQLAAAINAKTDKTGVTATASATSTAADMFGSAGATSFGTVTATAGSSYSLTVGGVQLASLDDTGTGGPLAAGDIDTALTGTNPTTQALAAAGITFTGKASDGTLRFSAADGADIAVTETVTGAGVKGGLQTAATAANDGSTFTATAGVSLSSSSGTSILVGGSNPSLAGLTAGTQGSYVGSSFTQDGAQASGTVTLEAGDQSLAGIRDAINKANVGVTASIISDGSDSPYHLVVTSNKTGASSSMKIGVAGADGLDPDPAIASLLGYDPAGAQGLTQTSAAQSTKLNVNGIEVSSNSMDVTGAVEGLTISVKDIGTSTLNVTRDTASVRTAIDSFVKAYNTLNSTISSLTAYNADTKTAGPLQGDATARGIQSQLRAALGKAVQGLGGGLTTLSQVGIAFQKDGSLALDSGKLSKAMTEKYDDIAGVFAAVGKATDGLISVSSNSTKTQAGNYAVNISQMATQGALKSENALAASTTIAANTTWTVTLNQTDPVTASKVQNIAIPAGTYNQKELAAMLRSAINGDSDFAGTGDTVETSVDADGKLSISSSKYGDTSNIAIASVTGTKVEDLFGAATPAKGLNVAGTIGGLAATGNGQTLTAMAGSAVEGLQLKVNGGATGDRGSISFSQGYAFQLNTLAAGFIGTDGMVTGKTNGLNATVKSIQKQTDTFNTRLTAIEARYRAQFTALDSMLSSMQTTQSYLTQQLAAISANAG